MDPSLVFLLAGGLGASLRALVKQDQVTLSKQSLVDVLVGALCGVLYPVVPIVQLPAGANLWQQGAFVALAGYAGASMVQNVIGRVPKKDEDADGSHD